MNDIKKNIENTINKLQEAIELFYQQNDGEAFKKFEISIANIDVLIKNIGKYEIEKDISILDKDKIVNILTEALEALETKDNVLMADILQYDFIEYLNEVLEKLD